MPRMPTEAGRELDTHFAALRALARDLVGEHDADDLVQDTALQALSHGPARPGPLGGWLRTVARRLAGRRRRTECRRERRERQVARAESVPPPQDAIEHRETFRVVTEAVLALAEPYQRTLLLRYLEDLSPRAIAARTGDSVATVKSRLQRGLLLLRERLDRGSRRRQWRPALSSGFGLGSGSTAAIVTGAVLMATATKWMFGGAAALLAVAAAWCLSGGQFVDAPLPSASQATAPLPPAAPSDLRRTTGPELLERQVAAPPDAGAAGAPTSIQLTGTVRSSEGSNLAGAIVTLRRHDQMRTGKTQDNGTYAMTDLQAGDWLLLCGAEGFGKYEVPITLEPAVQQFDIELRPIYVVKVQIQNAAGEFLPDLVARRMTQAELSVVATAEPLSRDLPVTEHTMYLAYGAGDWQTNSGIGGRQDRQLRKDGFAGRLYLDRDPPVHAALVLRHVVLQRQRIEPGQHELTFTLELDEVLARTGSVTLRLVDDATGEPLPQAPLLVGNAQAVELGQRTDADGRLAIDGQPPGLLRVQVWLTDYELLQRSVRVPPGGKLDLGEIRLSRAITITATTVDAASNPVSGVDLAWTCLDDRTFPQPLVENMSFPVNAAGQCKIALGRHRYVVIARGKRRYGYAAVDLRGGAPVPLTIPVVEPVGVAFRMRADTTAGYLVTISDLRGVPARALWFGGEYRPPGTSLPPGSYRVDIHDGDDRLVRSFALTVADTPVTIAVP
jgi:RNA polymerase sigma-70 factor (ECF subfamily)